MIDNYIKLFGILMLAFSEWYIWLFDKNLDILSKGVLITIIAVAGFVAVYNFNWKHDAKDKNNAEVRDG